MKLTVVRRLAHIQTVTKLFQPIITSPTKTIPIGKSTSLSQKLMLTAGIIHEAHNGLFHLLPLGVRALKKLTSLVEYHMENCLGAQCVSIPTLTNGDLWKLTGRMELAGVDLFKLLDRHKKEFVLAPTHEEAITNLIATVPTISYRSLPLLLYQISNKYRDEMRPRFGLIRSKEFLMKDLYSFDRNYESAVSTYGSVCEIYEQILKKIGIKHLKVVGDTGLMGGSFSHEYHYPASIGDDTLNVCRECDHGWNASIANNKSQGSSGCILCSSNSLETFKGIEVGHTFLLGTKYSSVLGAQYKCDTPFSQDLFMGCYGLGLTRMIGAALEVLSTADGLRWPSELVPYSVIVITPKEGSKESENGNILLNDLCHHLRKIDRIKNDIIIDDRSNLTIGRRLAEAKLTGYPNIIVIGKASLKEPPMFEFHNLNDNTMTDLSFECLFEHLKNNYGNCDNSILDDTELASRSL